MSYAKVAAAPEDSANPLQQRILQLRDPPPKSFSLTAALALLESQPGGDVYLLPIEFLTAWIQWAYYEPTQESARAQEALRLAAWKYGVIVAYGRKAPPPGPVDASQLSLEGHPLVLNPLTTLHQPENNRTQSLTIPSRQGPTRHESLPVDGSSNSNQEQGEEGPRCVAVPEEFYEILRSVHGVLCEDDQSISFQIPYDRERILLHHQVFAQHQSEHNHERIQEPPRPIEFRRWKLWQIAPKKKPSSDQKNALMERLLEEDQCDWVPEVHPVKLQYCIDQEFTGFCLVSREAPASQALVALQHVALPEKASECARIWAQVEYKYGNQISSPVQIESEWELVDLDSLKQKDNAGNRLTVENWLNKHFKKNACTWTFRIETRKSIQSQWNLDSDILCNRIQIGDFVDAQDVTGYWYEAVVRDLEDESITVHYIGWNSKWDAKLKRRRNSPVSDGMNPKLLEPAPLWSRVRRWREQVQVGDLVEVRDTSSLASRPKWYKGIVRKVSRPVDPPQNIIGAQLEMYPLPSDPEKMEPLLMMGRTQQILVEVEQERVHNVNTSMVENGGFVPNPPFLRWINLYGEEVCAFGTHLKPEQEKGPTTVDYVVDSNRKPVEVMKAHHYTLGAGFMRESLRGFPAAPGCVGLHNLGNSCYLNSTVQCLNHFDLITQYFLTDKYTKDLNRKNPLGSGGNVAVAYASLMKKIWSGEYSTLAPRLLKQTLAGFAPQFDNSYQHDSQEFCQFLMDGLHEDLNRVVKKPYVEELEGFGMKDGDAAIESWRKHLLRHDSIIVDYCQGMHRSHLTCPRCGRESIKFEVYSTISLPLATKKNQTTVDLEDCLDLFMEGEQLDERNAWYCPSCRQHVCALKMIALWSVPDVLIVHLKRFTFEQSLTSGGMLRSKVDNKVNFPINHLDLTKHVLGPINDSAPPIYELFGVSEHSGPTANSGHYTATVRSSADRQWYRCNDSHVGQTSGEASVTGGAYLLFYRRKKGSLRWAGMEKAMIDRNIDPHGGLERDLEGFTKVKSKKKHNR